MLLAAYCVEALGLVCLGLSHVFWIGLIALFCTGIANVMGEVPRVTIVQLSTPDDLRGRVSAVAWMFTAGGPQLGQLGGGAMAAVLGAPGAAVVGGSAAFLSVLAFGSQLLRKRPATAATMA
jgi:MFS family permease